MPYLLNLQSSKDLKSFEKRFLFYSIDIWGLNIFFNFRRRKVIFKICWKQKLLPWPKLIVLFRNTGVGGLNRKPRYDDDFFGSNLLPSVEVVLHKFILHRLASSLLQCAKLMQLLQTTEKKAEQQAEQVWFG